MEVEVSSSSGRRVHALFDREDESGQPRGRPNAGLRWRGRRTAGRGEGHCWTAGVLLATERGLSVNGARGGELEKKGGFGVVRQSLAVTWASAAERERLLASAARLAEQVFTDVATGETSDVAFATLHGLY